MWFCLSRGLKELGIWISDFALWGLFSGWFSNRGILRTGMHVGILWRSQDEKGPRKEST